MMDTSSEGVQKSKPEPQRPDPIPPNENVSPPAPPFNPPPSNLDIEYQMDLCDIPVIIPNIQSSTPEPQVPSKPKSPVHLLGSSLSNSRESIGPSMLSGQRYNFGSQVIYQENPRYSIGDQIIFCGDVGNMYATPCLPSPQVDRAITTISEVEMTPTSTLNRRYTNEHIYATVNKPVYQNITGEQRAVCQETPGRAFLKRRSCDASQMLDCLSTSEQHQMMMTSSIEGVLWSDEEETEYLYNEEINSAWKQDLAAIRQLLESETGGSNCPSCGMPFDKGKKRKLIDTCGHERCFSCMFRNEACPLCASSRNTAIGRGRMNPGPEEITRVEIHEPSKGYRRGEMFTQSLREPPPPSRLPKPPKQPSQMIQSCPTPPNTRKKFFLSPKALRSPFGQRVKNSENHPPLSGSAESSMHQSTESQRSTGTWPSVVFNKIRSLWSANSSCSQGLNQLAADDEGGNIKPLGLSENRKSNQSDLYMRLGLLLGDGSRNKRQKHKSAPRDSCTSLASLDAHTMASNNTSPVSTLTGSSEADVSVITHSKEPTSDSIGSLMSMSLSGNSNCSSSPISRRHSVTNSQNKCDDYFKNRRTSGRRSGRSGTRLTPTLDSRKLYAPVPQLTLRPLFFEVPLQESEPLFVGRTWLVDEIQDIINSSSPGIIISGETGTGKSAVILQLVEYSCFGRKKESIYEQVRELQDMSEDIVADTEIRHLMNLASHVVAYHFCQADNNCTCLVGEFVHSLAAQLCQAPRLHAYREYLLSEPHLLGCLSLKECIADPDLAFRRGVIEPLITLRKNANIDGLSSVILIDGLCEAEYHRPDHGDTISSFLTKHTPDMPPWLKVVATIRSPFIELTKQLPYTRLSLDEHCGNENIRKDLLDYINIRLHTSAAIHNNIRSALGKQEGINNPLSKFSHYTLQLAQGSFLFVKLMLDLIEKGHLVVKSSNYKVLPVSLAQIFLLQFNLKFPTAQSFEKITHILSVCLAALYPLTLSEIYYSVNSLLVDTFLPWEEFLQRFSTLSGFLIKRIDNTFMFFHPSFREWLIRRDDGESTKFLCDLRAGHAGIAFRLSRVQSPLDPEKTMELGHHILKAHLYRNMGPAPPGTSSRDLQAEWVAESSADVSQAISTLRNIYTPNVKVSRLMLLSGGSPNHVTDYLGSAPLLCIYAYQGILSMVMMLLEFGADVSLTNSQGCTALNLACQKGHTDIARKLMAAGAKLNDIDQTGQTALVHAARNGHGTTVSYLLGCEDYQAVDEDDIGTQHALVGAALAGHLNIVEYLLDTADLEVDAICSVTGETALTAACSSGGFCLAVVDCLIQRGADLHKPNHRGMDPLCLAARGGHNVIVERLLLAGATFVNQSKNPLIIAAAEGHPNVVEILLDHDFDVNAIDNDGVSALGWACLRGRLGCVVALLDRSASITQADSAGRTALCLACGGHPNIVETLLERGAHIEWVDHNGIRPLDRAIGQKNIQVVQCFLKRGAKLGPATWAMAAGKPDILLILLNKLLEDGNVLYRKGRLTEATHRYQYALKKINNIINDPIATGTTMSPEHQCTFSQLKTHFLLNQSRCKRKLNENTESADLASQAISLRPDSFECYYARSKAYLSLDKANEALQDVRKALLLTPQNNGNVKKVLTALQQEILNKITNKNVSVRDRNHYDTVSLNLSTILNN